LLVAIPDSCLDSKVERMDIGMIFVILMAFAYVLLYLNGRYYLREGYQSGGYSTSNPLAAMGIGV
jgi:hypothetical protein